MSFRFKRAILSIAMLGLLGVGPVASQAPDRLDVLIGFDRPPGAAAENLVRGFGGSIKHTYHLVPAIAANIPETAVAGLLRSQRVIRVELDGQFHAVDGELDDAWGVKRIGSGIVHNGGNKGYGVKVAVIDSGIDYTHPDLIENYVVGGYDFVNNDIDPMDDYGHGTHVAGIIAAEDDDSGVVGVAPLASLYGLKVLNSSGSGYFSDIIAALQWAVDNGYQVTNNSYGSSINPGSTVQEAFDNSYAAGVLHIAAAGNSGNPKGKGNNVIYPARWDSVVAVAATGSTDLRASFSSAGPANELAAPGVSILSTVPGGGYSKKSGTSMASPHAAGTAALIIAAGYVTSAGDVRQRLQDTADDLGDPGRDNQYGYGLVDADEAVTDPGTGDSPPWVMITSPSGSEPVLVSGTAVPIAANATDDFGVDTVEFLVEGISIGWGTLSTGAATDGSWAMTGGWDSKTVCNGLQTLSAKATDTPDRQTDLDSIQLDVQNDPDPCAGTGSEVVSVIDIIGCDWYGGKFGNKHLDIVLTVVDELLNPVEGATVSVEITLNDSPFSSPTEITAADGTAVFPVKNAAVGTYMVNLTTVDASPLDWDGFGPTVNTCDK